MAFGVLGLLVKIILSPLAVFANVSRMLFKLWVREVQKQFLRFAAKHLGGLATIFNLWRRPKKSTLSSCLQTKVSHNQPEAAYSRLVYLVGTRHPALFHRVFAVYTYINLCRSVRGALYPCPWSGGGAVDQLLGRKGKWRPVTRQIMSQGTPVSSPDKQTGLQDLDLESTGGSPC